MKNINYFDVIDEPEKAYWLGFFCADGSLWKNGCQLCIVLSWKDRKHLEKFAKLFDSPIKKICSFDKRTNKVYVRARCVLSSTHMWKTLVSKGVPVNKTEKLDGVVLDYIPKTLKSHFVRGYFDGDGSVGKYGKGSRASYRFTLVGTELFLQAIRDLMVMELGLRRNPVQKRKGVCALVWGGVWALSRIRSWLYCNASIYLERKKERFDIVPPKRGTSKYLGVYWDRARSKWVARLYYDGKTRYIGSYNSEIEAAIAYDETTQKIYGDSACKNFPTTRNI